MLFLDSSESASCDAVTLSGTYFCRGKGIYYAGRSSGEASLLGRVERMEEMGSSISQLEEDVSGYSSRCHESRKERERILQGIGALEPRLATASEELNEKRETLKKLEHDHIMKREKSAALFEALSELEGTRSETIAKLEETKLTLELQAESGDGMEAMQLEQELASLQKQRDSLEEELTEKRVDLASRKGSLERKREEIRGLDEMEKQFGDILTARTEEKTSSRDEIARLTVQIEEERSKVKELLEGESECQKDLDETNTALEERRSIVAGLEKELKQRQMEREEFMAKQNELRVKLSSIDTRMNDLVDRGREINKEDLSCYLRGEEIPFTEEEQAYGLEILERERRSLESIGPVNLAAVEEHEEKKKRLEFLVSQKEDLLKAKEELNEAIRKINKRARKQFSETFEIVRRYFSEIFEVLFEGGEADLSLSGDGDPLEADVVITARPKGKRLQDISLLSGGERALTALSLLFALYKAKPSPFCIFDEVDAPLDDANIMRFIKMLEKFQDETQFIIITHNKRTMEVADSLFGITMEEKGVSRVVSVDVRDIEDVLANRRAAPQNLAEVPVSSN
jgi:chromosome segregation protein